MTLETANRLYELRKKNNLSQEELAEKLGVSRQAVSKWERSEASPDTDNLIALAKIYGLTLDELVYGEREEKKEEPKEEAKEEPKEEPKQNGDGTYSDEDLFINVEDGKDRVKIGPKGIVVEDEDGEKVKISFNGITINTNKNEDSDDDDYFDDDDDEDDDDDDDELYETVYFTEGDIKGTDKKLHLKIKKTNKFWLEVPYPIICAIAYLLFGFYNVCGGWALSWIIFVTIPVYYSFVEAIYKRRFTEFCYPVFCAVVYLVCGLYYHNWHPSWLIFVTIPVYYPIAEALDRIIRNKK